MIDPYSQYSVAIKISDLISRQSWLCSCDSWGRPSRPSVQVLSVLPATLLLWQGNRCQSAAPWITHLLKSFCPLWMPLVPQADLGRPSSPCMGAAQRMDQDHPWWRVGIKKSKVALRLQDSAKPFKPRLVVEKGTTHGRPLQKILAEFWERFPESFHLFPVTSQWGHYDSSRKNRRVEKKSFPWKKKPQVGERV